MRSTSGIIIACLVVAGIQTQTYCQDISFTAHTITSSFIGGREVCAADVNDDGYMDLISGGGSEVAWWENNEDIQFTKHTISQNVDIARSVRAADIDGDGDSDAAAAVWGDNQILWWRNDGMGVFEEIPLEESVVGPHTVDLKDVNGDSCMDILCSGFDMTGAFSEIGWWENDGTERFTKHVISERFQQSPFIFGAFIDEDEHMDILACGEVNDEVVWWQSDGNQDFGANEHVIDVGFDAAHTVFARDLDLDGDTDILGTACMSSRIAWWENNGSEQFEKHSLGSLYGALWLDAADLDGDGDQDLFGAGMGDANISWWENDGDQNFTRRWIPGSLAQAYCVVCVDLDNDTDLDLVGIGNASNRINWYENDLVSSSSENSPLTGNLILIEAYPNPASIATEIVYVLPAWGQASLTIHNHSGQIIRHLPQGNQKDGLHRIVWKGSTDQGGQVAAGTYFLRVTSVVGAATSRLVWMK